MHTIKLAIAMTLSVSFLGCSTPDASDVTEQRNAQIRACGLEDDPRRGESSVVDVEHGRVEIAFRGTLVAVGPHEHWSSESPGQVWPGAPPPPQPAAPSGPALDAPDRSGSASTAPGTEPTGRRPSKPPANRDTTARPDLAPRTITDVDRDRAEYDRLAALEPTSPEPAIAGYLALARGTSRWADPALFAAARLAADRRDRRAVALLESYLRRFPGGANATDARQLLARVQAGPR